MYKLYAITNSNATIEKIEDAVKAGVTMLQLREKELKYDDFLGKALIIKEITDRYNIPLIINDNFEIAIKIKAAGVHLGQTDGDIEEIRKIAPKDFIIGVTAKTVDQAQEAEKKGATYLGSGAVNSSKTKTDAKQITNKELQEICSSVSIPVVAIGGITPSNVENLAGIDINGIAVSNSIFDEKDTILATKALLDKLGGIIK